MFVVLLNIAVNIGTGLDAMAIGYEETCTSLGLEYHAWDEQEPTTYHCTGGH